MFNEQQLFFFNEEMEIEYAVFYHPWFEEICIFPSFVEKVTFHILATEL